MKDTEKKTLKKVINVLDDFLDNQCDYIDCGEMMKLNSCIRVLERLAE